MVERYENLILTTPGIDDPESDLFMRGFAYGRFTDLDSEMARHWGVARNRPADECPTGKFKDEPA
jgi:hypothetical protein